MKFLGAYSVLIVVLCGCNSIDGHINEPFNTVSKSLEISNSIIENENLKIYTEIIESEGTNENIKSKADSVFSYTRSSISFIDSLKKVIIQIDPSGLDTKLAKDFMINSLAGNEFNDKIRGTYKVLSSETSNTLRKDSIKSVFNTIVDISDNPKWRLEYFNGASTASVITSLNMIKNHCLEASKLCLSDIRERSLQ